MKRFFLLLSFFLILGTVFLERTGMAWPWEAPLVKALGLITGRPFPIVTPVKLTSNKGVLVSQDVALVLRAIINFHPQAILIAQPLGDLSLGAVSLIKEGLETGKLEGVPIFFATLSEKKTPGVVIAPAEVLLFPEGKNFPQLEATLIENSPIGFIYSEKNHALPMMPLLGRVGDALGASLWWRGLFLHQSPSALLPVLLYERFLQLPNHVTLFLNSGAGLKSAAISSIKPLLFDDLLLHREELERGSIRPDLDLLFRNKTILIGDTTVVEQAAALQNAQQQILFSRLSTAWYGVLLMIFTLLFMKATQSAWIDFLLILIFSLLIYFGVVIWIFHSYGLLLPLFLPVVIGVVMIMRKLLPACDSPLKK